MVRQTVIQGSILTSDAVPSLETFKGKWAGASNGSLRGSTAQATPSETPLGSTRNTQMSSDRPQLHDGYDTEKSRRNVRFADECGQDLVSDVRLLSDWWEDCILGEDKCQACGHAKKSRRPNDLSTDSGICACCGKPLEKNRSELYRCIEELTRGVDAVLSFPGLVRRRKRAAVVFTDDNGASLCWMKAGKQSTYRLPCICLESVKLKDGETRIQEHRDENGKTIGDEKARLGEVVPGAGQTDLRHLSISHEQRPSTLESDSNDPKKRTGLAAAAEDVRIKIKWRLNPVSPTRKVTLENIKCSNKAMFARGIVELHDRHADSAG